MGPKLTKKTHCADWVAAQVDHLAPHVAVLNGSTVYWPRRLAMVTEFFFGVQLGYVQRGFLLSGFTEPKLAMWTVLLFLAT